MSHSYTKPEHAINPWQTKKAKEIYDNPWITLYHEEVITPGGTDGIYGHVHFKNTAIGIIPIDAEGNTWLVGQYRYVLDEWSWEIPEGGCPLNEDPLDGAKRELKEETGITAQDWKVLIEMDVSNCVSDERAIVYTARNLTIGESEPEESEQLEVIKVPLTVAIEMAKDGRIRDAISVAALLRLGVEIILVKIEVIGSNRTLF